MHTARHHPPADSPPLGDNQSALLGRVIIESTAWQMVLVENLVAVALRAVCRTITVGPLY